ncbi:MAG: DNA recombination protein RmuC [Bdellovibrionaceae bacterium]|jgi:DNA recombination protein RmuC|nr:DNA recombination protein RmuC [Pseudobdellovibrionaceae bacterium]
MTLTYILSTLFAISLTINLGIALWLFKDIKKQKKYKKKYTEIKIQNEQLLHQVKNLELQLESEKKFLKMSQESLKDTFQSLASKALEGNNKQFMELAKTVFEKDQQKAQSELNKKEESITNIVKPLKEVLVKYESQLSTIERDRQKSYLNIEHELKKVATSNDTLNSQTQALKDALKKPHIRGRWGEIQLKNCIDLAGMSEYSDVHFQDIQDVDGQKLIPDMTVKMPGGRLVIVDAKTPLEAFLSSLEASTDEERQSELVRHGKHVKGHIQSLSTKAYSEAFEGSADFTVMFLPNESFLYAALEVEPDLVEYAIQKKILIATPPTLIGLLKVIRYGWNEEKLAENAQKISEAGAELHKRVCDFMDAFMSVGKHLEKAKDEYSKGLSRIQSRVLVQAKRLEELGAKSSKSLPDIKIQPEIEAATQNETDLEDQDKKQFEAVTELESQSEKQPENILTEAETKIEKQPEA